MTNDPGQQQMDRSRGTMTANVVLVHKAIPIGAMSTVPDLVIRAVEPFPELRSADWVKEALDLHEFNGRAVAEALWQHLPGGTVDQILRCLLEHRASLLAVTF